MAIDLKKSYYVLLCEKVCIIFPLNMHYFTCEFFTELIWNVQALDLLQSEKLFYFFLIFNFENSAEIRTPTMVWNGEVGRGGAGRACPACLYVYFRAFFKCKSCTFLGSSDFFLFSFSFKHFCSELLLYIADNWKEYKNMCCSFKNYSTALVQYTKDFDKKKQW